MCRFLAYVGPEVLLADLVSRPENSLIRQSYQSRERSEPLNGDGFGVGWYSPEISATPGVFRSITPAWNNRNLLNLVDHIRTPCFFAHIRAAPPGSLVSEVNCHPFAYGGYLWMHNGTIEGFEGIERRLRQSLPDDLYHAIEGTTDTEHAFAVFLNIIRRKGSDPNDLREALLETIAVIEAWRQDTGSTLPSIYNFAVTDGTRIAAVRYVSDPHLEPISLYFSTGAVLSSSNSEETTAHGVIVASERLTDEKRAWTRVAPNHVLVVSQSGEVSLQLVPADISRLIQRTDLGAAPCERRTPD